MLTVTKHKKIIEAFKEIKLPNNFGLESKQIKWKVPGEILNEEFEFVLKDELISYFKSINYTVSTWSCVYNDESFTSISVHVEPIHGEDMMYNLFFLKKLFDDINQIHGTEEYEERFREVMKKVISNP
tara:strand:+ start:7945 stop:8328 length:384 start_codon:yes stop_codon:yes gene_type:complete